MKRMATLGNRTGSSSRQYKYTKVLDNRKHAIRGYSPAAAADSPLFGDGVTQPVAAAERFTRRCEPACRGILSPRRRPTFPRVL
jgi:hypothetical protein